MGTLSIDGRELGDCTLKLPEFPHCTRKAVGVGTDQWVGIKPTEYPVQQARKQAQEDKLGKYPERDGVWMSRGRGKIWFPFGTGPSLSGNVWRSGERYNNEIFTISEASVDQLNRVIRTTNNKNCHVTARCHRLFTEELLRRQHSD